MRKKLLIALTMTLILGAVGCGEKEASDEARKEPSKRITRVEKEEAAEEEEETGTLLIPDTIVVNYLEEDATETWEFTMDSMFKNARGLYEVRGMNISDMGGVKGEQYLYCEDGTGLLYNHIMEDGTINTEYDSQYLDIEEYSKNRSDLVRREGNTLYYENEGYVDFELDENGVTTRLNEYDSDDVLRSEMIFCDKGQVSDLTFYDEDGNKIIDYDFKYKEVQIPEEKEGIKKLDPADVLYIPDLTFYIDADGEKMEVGHFELESVKKNSRDLYEVRGKSYFYDDQVTNEQYLYSMDGVGLLYNSIVENPQEGIEYDAHYQDIDEYAWDRGDLKEVEDDTLYFLDGSYMKFDQNENGMTVSMVTYDQNGQKVNEMEFDGLGNATKLSVYDEEGNPNGGYEFTYKEIEVPEE